jgi:hypothetical protein
MNKFKISCGECGFELQDGMINSANPQKEQALCANCGSLARKIELNFHDSIKIYDDTSIILFSRKSSGGKKILLKGKYGSEFHHDSKTWQERRRTIDIANNKYDEEIINPSLDFKGKKSELLSVHTDHGSAKTKKRRK